jgi:hypothetical protein
MKHIAARLPRCQHRTPSGRRCRLTASGPASPLCRRHSSIETARHSADLAAALTAGGAEFKSAASINDFLSRLLLLLAEDRISSRRAAVLAYITNQLLRTISAMEEQAAVSNPRNRPVKIIWDLPHPAHEPADPAS